MRILTYLNTNETFRNLLLYGIEGENYEIVLQKAESITGEIKEYKTVRRLNDSYMMAPEKTGNFLLAYPLEGELPNIREYQKLHNGEALTSLDFGFRLDFDDSILHFEAMNEYCAFTDAVYEELMAIETTADLEIFLKGYKDKEHPENNIPSIFERINAEENAKVKLMLSQGHYKGCGEEFYAEYTSKVEIFGLGDSLAGVYFKWLNETEIYVLEEGM
jgi:hypothetical protein